MLACLLVLFVAGCGAESERPAKPAKLPAPDVQLADAVDALDDVRSAHLEARTNEEAFFEPHIVSGDFANESGGAARFTLQEGSAQAEIRLVDGIIYVNGNRDYWQSKAWVVGKLGLRIADQIADRWVAAYQGCRCLRAEIESYRPAAVSASFDNLTWEELIDEGAGTHNGEDVRVIATRGEPNTADPTGDVYIAASANHYLQGFVQTYGKGIRRRTEDRSYTDIDVPFDVAAPAAATPANATVRRMIDAYSKLPSPYAR